MYRVAIDTGGTFTDYIAVDETGQFVMTKFPTDRKDPAAGIIAGLHKLAGLCGLDLENFLARSEQIVHGTTLALNALLEEKVARTALLTTEGFRDTLEMRRSRRAEQWDLRAKIPPVLVPRYLRIGIRERLNYEGKIITSLDREQLKTVAEELIEQGVEAVAVCFLFSFLNPVHEEETANILRELMPGVFVTTSAAVAPRIREYERTSTTVLNACLAPVLADYLDRLEELLGSYGWNRSVYLVLNSGGLNDAATVRHYAVKTLLSGPAGGACGGEIMAEAAACPNLVVADMGGTSFDVNIIVNGGSRLVSEAEISGYPVSMPIIDIKSVGTGGGSIASIDQGGNLMVGPQSAGSYPGPASYGRGGTNPTVTDAALLLGLINPARFLDGTLRLEPDLARKAFEDEICKYLEITTAEAALATYQIAAAQMSDTVRLITVQQGLDPRDFSLVAAGGAFPIFAAQIARELGMEKVIVPLQGPVFCAWGMLGAPCQYDLVKSCIMTKDQWNSEKISTLLRELKVQGDKQLTSLGIAADDRKYELTLEMKYSDQHHEIDIVVDSTAFEKLEPDAVDAAFHSRHEELYGYAERDKSWEINNVRLKCGETIQRIGLPAIATASQASQVVTRTITYDSGGPIPAKVYNMSNAQPIMEGPALIELPFTTVLVPQGFTATIESGGFILLYDREVHQ